MKMKLALSLVAISFAMNASAKSAVSGYEWADHNLNSCISMLQSPTMSAKHKDVLVVPDGTCTLSVNAAEKAMAIDNASMQANEKELASLMKKIQPYLDNGFDNTGMKLWSAYYILEQDNQKIIQVNQARTSKIAIVKPYLK
ncbi:hypothetical protein Z042_01360 [Chania multitudinisentens RB-25]|uniref:Uncharacterized protein n=1 Tax=Chania multitudinisentens RB-25 TaxID=1441930 RepID=W0LFC4_9GAMM|nr:hypothetical protein [Chania multitudinisentens]AHG22568.1 hypothetical protein Z042_01360 [Chania multitudinisentens RB-25]